MRGRIALLCATTTLAVTVAAYAANLDLDAISGVYRKSFVNSDVTGQKFRGEDILEIVKVSRNAAYFRTHLDFLNGHMCGLWGVAEIAGSSLVYREVGRDCEFHINVRDGQITFDDKNGTCRIGTCGSRGGYAGTAFDLKNRRTIRYMQRLVASSEYRQAVTEYEARHRQ